MTHAQKPTQKKSLFFLNINPFRILHDLSLGGILHCYILHSIQFHIITLYFVWCT